MIRKVQLLLFFLGALMSLSAHSAEWYAAAASNNIMVFVDKSSLQRKGDTARAWQWQFFTPPIGRIDSAKSRVVFECGQQKRKTEYMIAISGPAAVEKEGKIDAVFESVQPGSIESSVMDVVCKGNFQGKGEQNLDLNQVREFMFKIGR